MLKRTLRGRRLDWTVILAIAALHVGCIAAPFTFSWSALAVMFVTLWIGSGLGICLGYHRLLTHRSFKTPKWVEYSLAILGCTNWQGGPITWVGTHRIHHAESDHEGDPHTPRHGFTWAHMLWTMAKPAQDPADAAKDLQRDPIMVAIDRWFFLPMFALAGILFALGGWDWVVWGVCVRTVVAWHGTWFVNSAAHTWGYRNFQTTDGSRNTWWVALVSFGEGWHNNHHAQQRSATHGMRWWEIDTTYWTILMMKWVGLARQVVRPRRPAAIARAKAQAAKTEGPGLSEKVQTMSLSLMGAKPER